MAMKPIETRYKGYRFRSRLEARWAVFFDALGIKWEYEPEGFEFDDGTRYLPDFKITSAVDGVPYIQFVEIKGSLPTKEERSRAELLSKSSGCCVEIFTGDPLNVAIHSHSPKAQPTPDVSDRDPSAVLYFLCWSFRGFSRRYSHTEIFNAGVAARSARFEFGECGVAA